MVRQFLYKLRYSNSHGGVLARGAMGVFIVKIAGAGLLFGLNILLARLLGPEQYGIYIYAFTWINILVILCLLGFQTSLVRFVAEYYIKQQWSLFRGILRQSRRLVLGFSILIALIGTAIVRYVGSRIPADLAAAFYVAFCILPFFAFTRLQQASLRALKYVVRSELLLSVFQPALMCVGFFCFFLWRRGDLVAPDAMTANFAAVIITAVIGTVFLRRLLPQSVEHSQPEYANKLWISVSLPLLLITGMHIILKRTDIVMLGSMKGSQEAGIYAAASRVSDLVVFALMSINSILAPMISELYHTGQKERLQRIISLASTGIFIFTFLIILVLLFAGKFVLKLFGLAFVAAYIPLMILLTGQVINSLAGPVGLVLSMSGRQQVMGVIISTSAVANIVLNIVLIPRFDLNGAAVATAVTMVMWNVAMLWYVHQKLRLNSTIFRVI